MMTVFFGLVIAPLVEAHGKFWRPQKNPTESKSPLPIKPNPFGSSFSSNFNTERFTIICNHPATADRPCAGLDTIFKKFYYETPIEPTFVITCPDNPGEKCITTQQHIMWPPRLDYGGRQYTFEKVKTTAFSTAKRISIPTESTYSNQNQAMMIVEDAPYGYPIYRQLTFYYKNEKSTLTVFGNVDLNSGYR